MRTCRSTVIAPDQRRPNSAPIDRQTDLPPLGPSAKSASRASRSRCRSSSSCTWTAGSLVFQWSSAVWCSGEIGENLELPKVPEKTARVPRLVANLTMGYPTHFTTFYHQVPKTDALPLSCWRRSRVPRSSTAKSRRCSRSWRKLFSIQQRCHGIKGAVESCNCICLPCAEVLVTSQAMVLKKDTSPQSPNFHSGCKQLNGAYPELPLPASL